MRPTQMLAAENTGLDQSGKSVVSGLLPGLIVLNFKPSEKMPVNYTFSLLISFMGKDSNDVGFEGELIVLSPSGIVITRTPVSSRGAQMKPIVENELGIYAGLVNLDLRNFAFSELGVYTFKYESVDGNIENEITVTARKVDNDSV